MTQQKYAKYTIEVFRPLGDEDRPDGDNWGVHHGKGQSAAGNLAHVIEEIVGDGGMARAVGREIVGEVPQWLSEEPVFEDDPDPAQETLQALLALRASLRESAE